MAAFGGAQNRSTSLHNYILELLFPFMLKTFTPNLLRCLNVRACVRLCVCVCVLQNGKERVLGGGRGGKGD